MRAPASDETPPESSAAAPLDRRPFWQQRSGRPTALTRRGPAPQRYEAQAPPPGVEAVSYASGPLQLHGWLALPPARAAKVPAVVYLHGGWAFGADDMADARPFLDAGHAVFCPTLRGENGNPGDFELFYGELDDAVAAVRWLALRPEIDPSRIYAFGHSAGGALAALLSLVPELPLVATGSVGGLYAQDVFFGWTNITPFDVRDPTERSLRVLLPHVADMKRRHVAYLGKRDGLSKAALVGAQAAPPGSPLEAVVVEGDRQSSLQPGAKRFLEEVLTR